jgi:hypothetical protein
VVKSHILHEVPLFTLNMTDLDREVDKHPWWGAAVTTSTGWRPKMIDIGKALVWITAGMVRMTLMAAVLRHNPGDGQQHYQYWANAEDD